MRITAEFVTSAAGASGLPDDGLSEIALVGRSNVGKSSLINALTRQRIARTSGAPGKTRLANIYRVARGTAAPLYLVDLPGYGYARAPRQAGGGPGGVEDRRRQAAREFEELTRAYFGARGLRLQPERGDSAEIRRQSEIRLKPDPTSEKVAAALLLVDARHPGLENDKAAWNWLIETVAERAIVATKIDKLPRGQRIRAVRELESVFEDSVLPCSADTGEGLDELWNLIERLANSRNP